MSSFIYFSLHDSASVLVVGMHRSGTSLPAGVLNTLGITFPGKAIAADIHNPDGYFEWAEVVHTERLLLI